MVIAAFCALAAVLAAGKTACAAPFKDVQGHWAEQVIQEMVAKGVVKGYEDGTFRPDAYVSREEAITMVGRLYPDFVQKPRPFLNLDYADIKGRWSSQYVEAAVKTGLALGYSDFTFKPEDPMIRFDAAAFMLKARFYGLVPANETEARKLDKDYYRAPAPDKMYVLMPIGGIADVQHARLQHLNDPAPVFNYLSKYRRETAYVDNVLDYILQMGIVRGYWVQNPEDPYGNPYSEEQYGWLRYVTRAEFCTMLKRLMDYNNYRTTWISDWYQLPIAQRLPLHFAGQQTPAQAKAKVEALGQVLKQNYPDEEERAKAVYDLIRMNFAYHSFVADKMAPQLYAKSPAQYCGVSVLATAGFGDQYMLANAYVALARAAGLEAYLVEGTFKNLFVSGVYVERPWAWAEVKAGGKTIQCDPSLSVLDNPMHYLMETFGDLSSLSPSYIWVAGAKHAEAYF